MSQAPQSTRGSTVPPLADTSGTAEDFEENPLVRVRRLERALADQRKFARKMSRQLHRRMQREVTSARKRAQRAERELREMRRRAEAAEAELDAVRRSTTWRAGRTVLAVPRKIRDLRS